MHLVCTLLSGWGDGIEKMAGSFGEFAVVSISQETKRTKNLQLSLPPPLGHTLIERS